MGLLNKYHFDAAYEAAQRAAMLECFHKNDEDDENNEDDLGETDETTTEQNVVE